MHCGKIAPRSLSFRFVLILSALSLTACGHLYHLRGHTHRNQLNPPNVVMKCGERRKVLTEGLSLLALVPATQMIQIQNTSVVRVEPLIGHEAYLAAVGPGRTRAWYSYRKPSRDNQGFIVTVVER